MRLYNATVNFSNLALKIHNPAVGSDEKAGLFISNLRLAVGEAYGLRIDQGRVVCALLHAVVSLLSS